MEAERAKWCRIAPPELKECNRRSCSKAAPNGKLKVLRNILLIYTDVWHTMKSSVMQQKKGCYASVELFAAT